MTSPAPEPEASGVADLIFDAWNSHDAHALGSAFPVDGEFTDVLGHHAVGPEAIEQLHAMPFARLFAKAELTLRGVRVRHLAPELAAVHADWAMEGHTTPQGDPLPAREGSMHIVTTLRDGRWLPLDVHNADYGATYANLRDRDRSGNFRGQD